MDSQESSLAPQLENISSLALSLLYGPALTSSCYWDCAPLWVCSGPRPVLSCARNAAWASARSWSPTGVGTTVLCTPTVRHLLVWTAGSSRHMVYSTGMCRWPCGGASERRGRQASLFAWRFEPFTVLWAKYRPHPDGGVLVPLVSNPVTDFAADTWDPELLLHSALSAVLADGHLVCVPSRPLTPP